MLSRDVDHGTTFHLAIRLNFAQFLGIVLTSQHAVQVET